MIDKNIEILKTFKKALPKMTEQDKEKLLAFGEGVAMMADRKKQEKEASENGKAVGA